MHLLWSVSVLGYQPPATERIGLESLDILSKFNVKSTSANKLINTMHDFRWIDGIWFRLLAKEEKVLIGATIDLLRIMADLKLTEREIALLNAVILFHPGEFCQKTTTQHTFSLTHDTSHRWLIWIEQWLIDSVAIQISIHSWDISGLSHQWRIWMWLAADWRVYLCLPNYHSLHLSKLWEEKFCQTAKITLNRLRSVHTVYCAGRENLIKAMCACHHRVFHCLHASHNSRLLLHTKVVKFMVAIARSNINHIGKRGYWLYILSLHSGLFADCRCWFTGQISTSAIRPFWRVCHSTVPLLIWILAQVVDRNAIFIARDNNCLKNEPQTSFNTIHMFVTTSFIQEIDALQG